jgi:hypothetical protein
MAKEWPWENRAMNATQNSNPVQRTTSELFHLLLTSPLYRAITLRDAEEELRGVRTHAERFDMHCPRCKRSTTWTPHIESYLYDRVRADARQTTVVGPGANVVWDHDFELTLTCGRNPVHVAQYHFKVLGDTAIHRLLPRHASDAPLPPPSVVKIGQWPSMTDFALGDLADFDKAMTDAQRNEFVRAVNCAAHGFHVAACVHFRRVFESVLQQARDAHMEKMKVEVWPEFRSARTDERIRMLRAELPAFMVEHPELYGLLSLGVHELTEQQCAEELPTVRKAIELIMRDRWVALQRQREREDLAKLLARSVDQHKKP